MRLKLHGEPISPLPQGMGSIIITQKYLCEIFLKLKNTTSATALFPVLCLSAWNRTKRKGKKYCKGVVIRSLKIKEGRFMIIGIGVDIVVVRRMEGIIFRWQDR